MKKLLLFICSFTVLGLYAQRITKGPQVGEIYFTGPTTTITNKAIYYSNNYGLDAVCMDSITCTTTVIGAIVADKTSGGLYYSNISEALFYSSNYGQFSTWMQKNSGIGNVLHSGITEGHIYEGAFKHSEDYGSSFINHQLNNYIGIYKESEIGYNNKGYLLTYQIDGTDTLYFSISYDNFENIEVIYKFNMWAYDLCDLSFGCTDGELFLYNEVNKSLYFTNNSGYNWEKKTTFGCPNLPIKGIACGQQEGELFMLVEYIQISGQRRHTYIYHSIDYGESFAVYHPVDIGPDPVYADFMAEDTLVEPDDPVQFIDLSNEAESWEWDFNNDGIIDSYNQNPTWAYEDTGYYAVNLKIQSAIVEDYAFRNNYIHVTNIISIEKNVIEFDQQFKCFPNPFSRSITIELSGPFEQPFEIAIFDIVGRQIKSIKKQTNDDRIVWEGNDDLGKKCLPGIYFIKVNKSPYIQKVVLTN